MAVSQIVCFGDNLSIAAETYVPAAGHIAAYTIVPIGNIIIFTGVTSVHAALEAM
jgi:phospholipase/lecithinase/hemolysin